jgi:hypothetical protein
MALPPQALQVTRSVRSMRRADPGQDVADGEVNVGFQIFSIDGKSR